MKFEPVRVACVQAAPAFLDKKAGVAKSISLIEEAAREGAKLVAFPECWIPGYPWWVWLGSPADGMQYVRPHFENCITVDGEEVAQICACAKANDIHVVLGFSERSGGSLYIAQLIVAPDGSIVQARRNSRRPTSSGPSFGEGDGSDIRVHSTALGRVGALCCWEHLNPLSKYAMYAQNEQIHIASWPSFSLYTGQCLCARPHPQQRRQPSLRSGSSVLRHRAMRAGLHRDVRAPM